MDLVKTELYKISKRKSFRVFMILYSVIFVGAVSLYLAGENILGFTILNEGQFLGAILWVMMSFLLPLMSIYLISSSFLSDFGHGTMKNMFLLPVKREKLFFSKFVAVQFLVGGVLLAQFIISIAISLFQDGGLSLSTLISYFVSYLGAFLILGLINIIGGNLALITTSTGLAIIIAYVLYLGSTVLNIYIPRFAHISIATLINDYSNLLRLSNITQLLSLFAYYIILVVTGILLFDKKEEVVCQYD